MINLSRRPALDDALGIAFDDNPFGIYMKSLRMYMPPQHRAFVEAMRDRPSIRDFVAHHRHGEPGLVAAYNRCLTTLGTFRRDHLKFTARYIHAQTPRGPGNSTEVGTGGTPYMAYLKKHVGEVSDHLIEG